MLNSILYNIQGLWNRYVFRVKHHFLYAAFAQIVIMAINVLIFITSELDIPFSSFYCVIPTYFYLLLITLFYMLTHRMNVKVSRQSVFTWIMMGTIVAVNVIYTVITTMDEESWFYYLDTVIVQAINAFYIMIYSTINGKQVAQGRHLYMFRIFGCASAISALLAFYFTFVDPMVMWGMILTTTVLLFATYMVAHENFKKTFPKKKRLRSYSQRVSQKAEQ